MHLIIDVMNEQRVQRDIDTLITYLTVDTYTSVELTRTLSPQ